MRIPLTLATLLMTGCSLMMPVKDEAVHHLLEPVAADRPLNATKPAIAVSRAALPSFLDSEQLVTRVDGALVASDLDLWGEPLDLGISRVVAGNLSRLTRSANIMPVGRFVTLDYTDLLELRITQFQPDATNSMVLQGAWKLHPVSGENAESHYFRIATPLTPELPAGTARVNAMNRALLGLAKEILATDLLQD